MDRLTMIPGRVVLSTQGRDEGRYFVVLEVIDENFVLMADGLTRKIAHPKKKKVKHLKLNQFFYKSFQHNLFLLIHRNSMQFYDIAIQLHYKLDFLFLCPK